MLADFSDEDVTPSHHSRKGYPRRGVGLRRDEDTDQNTLLDVYSGAAMGYRTSSRSMVGRQSRT